MRNVAILLGLLSLCGTGVAWAGTDACPMTSTFDVEEEGLFPPESVEVLEPPKHGPCTMSYDCAATSGCGTKIISCSGSDYCEMGSDLVDGPSSCSHNIWVRCDWGPKIKCIEPLIP